MSGAVQLITRRGPVEVRGKASLSVSAINEDQLTFEGVASKTELDRQGDIVDAAGLVFPESVPLLVAHDHRLPVGRAYLRRVGDVIRFRAQLARVTDGELGERIATAWLSVRAGLTDSVSIGFRPIDMEPLSGGGWRYTKAEILELSIVAVPALQSARIDPRTVKALEHPTGTDRVPMLLTRQQLEDLRMAEARRALGKMANKPVPAAVLHATVQRLHDQDRSIAQAVAELDDRISALEGGQSRDISREHPGAVRLLKVR